MELTHLSLFAGIGGIDLAAEWAGFKTILFVEIDPYCQKVLRKHWPDVPIIGDIRDATKEKIMVYTKSYGLRQGRALGSNQIQQENRSQESQVRCRNGCRSGRDSNSPITLITGGFPCQPVSHAGKRRGKADDRWLWPEMLRVISEVRSTWVVAENVAGLLQMGFNDCVSDLESEGYETISFLIPACAVNAPHQRNRVFIVAHSINDNDRGRRGQDRKEDGIQGVNRETLLPRLPSGASQDVADSQEQGLSVRISYARSSKEGITRPQQDDWWAVEPNVGRVAYGVPSRVDRLKCLGNAVVPQQIYLILKAIAEIERL